MSKNKRMIYVWDENVAFFDSLAKSKKASGVLNKALLEAQSSEKITPGEQMSVDNMKVPKDYPGHDHPDPRMRSLHREIWLKEERDRRLQAQAQGK